MLTYADVCRYLVKWQKQPYDEATWEDKEALFTPADLVHLQVCYHCLRQHTSAYVSIR
jgi:hypothetical protein